MKKSLLLTGIVAMGLALASCGDKAASGETSTEATAAAAGISGKFNVDAAKTVVGWTGSKVAYSHVGTVKVQSGAVQMENGSITGGEFVIDMNTIMENGKGTFNDEGNGHVVPQPQAQLRGGGSQYRQLRSMNQCVQEPVRENYAGNEERRVRTLTYARPVQEEDKHPRQGRPRGTGEQTVRVRKHELRLVRLWEVAGDHDCLPAENDEEPEQ